MEIALEELIVDETEEYWTFHVPQQDVLLYGREVMAHIAYHEHPPELYKEDGEWHLRIYKCRRSPTQQRQEQTEERT